jgi:hypothetical protein
MTVKVIYQSYGKEEADIFDGNSRFVGAILLRVWLKKYCIRNSIGFWNGQNNQVKINRVSNGLSASSYKLGLDYINVLFEDDNDQPHFFIIYHGPFALGLVEYEKELLLSFKRYI